MEIGKKIKDLRIAKGLTQEELADRSELSKGFISQLERDLKENGAKQLLETYGYQSTDPGYALNRLAGRLTSEGEFPHEIGLFLGYPLEDVQGFIQNHGKNSLCTGCWKVYGNLCEARKCFARFEKCRDIYRRLWNEGKSIYQLTVAA